MSPNSINETSLRRKYVEFELLEDYSYEVLLELDEFMRFKHPTFVGGKFASTIKKEARIKIRNTRRKKITYGLINFLLGISSGLFPVIIIKHFNNLLFDE